MGVVLRTEHVFAQFLAAACRHLLSTPTRSHDGGESARSCFLEDPLMIWRLERWKEEGYVDMYKFNSGLSSGQFMPLYVDIMEALRAFIERKELQPGDRLPTEQVLMKRFGASRITVTRALRDLEVEGLVDRRQGVGTFVARSKVLVELQRLKSFTEDMLLRGLAPGGRILRLEQVPAPAEVGSALRVPTGSSVPLIVRLRTADSEPMGLHESYLRPDLQIDPEELKQSGSLYAILRDRYQVRLEEADETIEAVTATTAQAELLAVGRDSPLLRVVRLSYDQRHRPAEIAYMLYRGDRYHYHAKLEV